MRKLTIIVLLIFSSLLFGADVLDEREKIAKDYLDESLYTESISQYKQNMKFYKKKGSNYKYLMSWFWLARNYDEQEKYKKSLALYQEMLPQFKKLYKKKKILDVVYITNNMAVCYKQIACENNACCYEPNKKLLNKSLEYYKMSIGEIEKYKEVDPYEDYYELLGSRNDSLADVYELLEKYEASILFRKKSIEYGRKDIDVKFLKNYVGLELESLASSYISLSSTYSSGSKKKKQAIAVSKEFLKYLKNLEEKKVYHPLSMAKIYAHLASLHELDKDKKNYYFKASTKMEAALWNTNYSDVDNISNIESFINYHKKLVDLHKYNPTFDKSKLSLRMKSFIDIQESKHNNYLLAKSYYVVYEFSRQIDDGKKKEFYIKKAIERIKVAIKNNKDKRDEYSEYFNKYTKEYIYDTYAKNKYTLSSNIKEMVKEYEYFYKKYYWNKPKLKIESYIFLADFFYHSKDEGANNYSSDFYLKALKYLEKHYKNNQEELQPFYESIMENLIYGSGFKSSHLNEAIVIQKRMNLQDKKLLLATSYDVLANRYEKEKREVTLIYATYMNAISTVKEHIKKHPNEEGVDGDGEEGIQSLIDLKNYSQKLANVYLENKNEKNFLKVLYELKNSAVDEAKIEIYIAYLYEQNKAYNKSLKHINQAIKFNKKEKFIDEDVLFYRQEIYEKLNMKKEMKQAMDSFIQKSKINNTDKVSYLRLLSSIYLWIDEDYEESLNYMNKANKELDKKFKLQCHWLSDGYWRIDIRLDLDGEGACIQGLDCDEETESEMNWLAKVSMKLEEVCEKGKVNKSR